MPQRRERPPADEASLPVDGWLGLDPYPITPEMAARYLADSHESAAIYGEQGLVHPRDILRSCNFVISRNVLLGPWIHTGSRVQHLRAVPVGSELSVRARITGNYEHKGHRFVEIDALVLSQERTPVARIAHTAIYRPRQVAAALTSRGDPAGTSRPYSADSVSFFAAASPKLSAARATAPCVAVRHLFDDAGAPRVGPSAWRIEVNAIAMPFSRWIVLRISAGRSSPRRIRLQYLFDQPGVRATLQPAGTCRSPARGVRGITRLRRRTPLRASVAIRGAGQARRIRPRIGRLARSKLAHRPHGRFEPGGKCFATDRLDLFLNWLTAVFAIFCHPSLRAPPALVFRS